MAPISALLVAILSALQLTHATPTTGKSNLLMQQLSAAMQSEEKQPTSPKSSPPPGFANAQEQNGIANAQQVNSPNTQGRPFHWDITSPAPAEVSGCPDMKAKNICSAFGFLYVSGSVVCAAGTFKEPGKDHTYYRCNRHGQMRGVKSKLRTVCTAATFQGKGTKDCPSYVSVKRAYPPGVKPSNTPDVDCEYEEKGVPVPNSCNPKTGLGLVQYAVKTKQQGDGEECDPDEAFDSVPCNGQNGGSINALSDATTPTPLPPACVESVTGCTTYAIGCTTAVKTCTACTDGTYLDSAANACQGCTACKDGEYAKVACGATNDNQCALCGDVTQCSDYVSTTCTQALSFVKQCKTCNLGFTLSGNTCQNCPADTATNCNSGQTTWAVEGSCDKPVCKAAQCEPGFTNNNANGECVDVDECTANTDGCNEFATCENTVGAYTCTCKPGYGGDGKTCEKCTAVANCLETVWPTEGSCTGAKCAPGKCSPGFQNSPVDGSCIDVDECTANTDGCDEFATCENTVGAYTCTCKPGYGGDGKTCEKCTAVTNCLETVWPTEGSCTGAKCAPGKCSPGFQNSPVDGSCVDVDECTANTDDCNEFATCENTVGAYTCTCKQGYGGDGKACEKCAAVANCLSTIYPTEGSCTGAKCEPSKCAPGYTNSADGTCEACSNSLPGCTACSSPTACTSCKAGTYLIASTQTCGVCKDVTGCSTYLNAGTCTAANPTKTCATCGKGYSGPDASNKCMLTDSCGLSGQVECALQGLPCTNIPGSHKCGCLTGFRPFNFTCVDADECLTNTHKCDPNALCTNTEGSFTCACAKGYYGTGATCQVGAQYCKDFVCTAGTGPSPTVNLTAQCTTLPCTPQQCCAPSAVSCSTFTCPAGYQRKAPIPTCSTTGCTSPVCCDQLCSAFTCPTGTVANTYATNCDGQCSSSQCCKPYTCGSAKIYCGEYEPVADYGAKTCDATTCQSACCSTKKALNSLVSDLGYTATTVPLRCNASMTDGLVNFEDAVAKGFKDESRVNSSYSPYGLTFALVSQGTWNIFPQLPTPIFEQTFAQGALNGFQGSCVGSYDNDRMKTLGTFFITAGTLGSKGYTDVPGILITYPEGTGSLEASGMIYDIDGSGVKTEVMMATAYDVNKRPIASAVSPRGVSADCTLNPLESNPWVFVLGGPTNKTPIKYVKIEWVGTTNAIADIGLAFDNFRAFGCTFPARVTTTY